MSLVQAKEHSNQLPAKPEEAKTFVEDVARRLDVYNAILTSYDEALMHIRTDAKQLDTGFKGTGKKIQNDQLSKLGSYVTALKLEATNDRNQLMADELIFHFDMQQAGQKSQRTRKTRPEDLINLFDKMSGTLDTLIDVYNAANSPDGAPAKAVAAAEPTIVQQHRLRKQWYAACRQLYSTEAYAAAGKTTQAFVLFSLTRRLAAEVLEANARLVVPVEGLASRAELLVVKAESRAAFLHASALLEQQRQEESLRAGVASLALKQDKAAGGGGTLLERLGEFDCGDAKDGHRLVEFPPSYAAAPCKPILFDLAFNYIEFPDVSKRFTAASAPQPKPAPQAAPPKTKPAPPAQAAAAPTPAPAQKGWLGWLAGK